MKCSILCSLFVFYVIFCHSHIRCKKNKQKKNFKLTTTQPPEDAYDSHSSAILSEEWAYSNYSNISSGDSKRFIVRILKKYLDNDTLFLELGSGDGEHITHFAQNFPLVTFQPTLYDANAKSNIHARQLHNNFSNIIESMYVDVHSPSRTWFDGSIKEESVDYMYVANLLHRASLKLATGIFEGAARYLKPGGFLFMYGPFKLQGHIYGDENVKLDRYLRKENYMWGLREVWGELNEEAFDVGIYLEMLYKLPNHNQILAWKKDELMQYHLDESKIPVDKAATDMVNYFDDDYDDVAYNTTVTYSPIPTTYMA